MQRMASAVTGRLDEWLETGAASRQDSGNSGGVVAASRTLRDEVRRVWVKVDAVEQDEQR